MVVATHVHLQGLVKGGFFFVQKYLAFGNGSYILTCLSSSTEDATEFSCDKVADLPEAAILWHGQNDREKVANSNDIHLQYWYAFHHSCNALVQHISCFPETKDASWLFAPN